MDVITGIMLIFSVIGALDRILGDRFGLGREFERGFMLLGPLALSMIGMIVLAPVLASMLSPALDWIYRVLRFDPSLVTSLIFPNDMGGSALATQVAKDAHLGRFNGMIVTTMMGGTIAFTIPFALGTVEQKQHEWLLLGLLCGVITIPVGCLTGGMVQGVTFSALLYDILPLILLSSLLAVGLMHFPKACTCAFSVLGTIIKILITIGLSLSIIRFLSGYEVLPGLTPFEDAAMLCLNAAAVMTGAFPLLHILSRLLKKPLEAFSRRLHINSDSAMGLVSCLANSMTTFESMRNMDEKGVMLNSAFAVSAAFVFGDHLAFTLAYDAPFLPGMIAGKLIAGILAVILAHFAYERMKKA